MAHDHRVLGVDLVEHRLDVGGHGLEVVHVGDVGLPVPSQVEEDQPVTLGEVRQDGVPGLLGLGDAVDEDEVVALTHHLVVDADT